MIEMMRLRWTGFATTLNLEIMQEMMATEVGGRMDLEFLSDKLGGCITPVFEFER